MGKEKIVKIIGMSVSRFKRKVPKGAVSCDFVKGNGPKGRFGIWSYKDEQGTLIAREIKCKKGNDTTMVVRGYYNDTDSGLRIIGQKTDLNNEKTGISQKILIFDKTKKCKDAWMFDINFCDCYDEHTISYLSPGKSSQNISYSTFWDGNKPFDIKVVSDTGEKLPNHNLEYLPLVGELGNKHSTDSIISHISVIQEKKFGLEGITPPVKRVPSSELNEVAEFNSDGKCFGDCNIFNGQIRVDEEIKNSRRLLNILGHEYKHASDISNMSRYEESVGEFRALTAEQLNIMEKKFPGMTHFNEKSIQKGIIPKNSEEGKEVHNLIENWDFEGKLPWGKRNEENRAVEAAKEEVGKLDMVIEALKKLFNAKFWRN